MMPQMSPQQNLAAFAQAAPQPQMPQQRPPMMPQQGPPQVQQAAQQGRGGDALVAHLTPGEIMIPPQIQTPELLQAIQQAFMKAGASPAQFMAGSPQSKTNPQTGMPEYGMFDSLLPSLLGIGGSFLMPELAPELLGSGLLSQSVGSAIGTGLGGLLSGQSGGQSALGGLLAGAGSYGAGSLFGGSGSGGGSAAGQTASSTQPSNATASQVSGGNLIPGQSGPPMQDSGSNWQNLWGNTSNNINKAGLIGGGVGGIAPSLLGLGQSSSTQPQMPAGYNQAQPSVASLPSWQQQIGQNSYKGPSPNFQGYNPLAPNATGFNFYGSPTG